MKPVDGLRNRSFLVLALIFLLALFLRLHNLESTPAGFHQDEVVNAYVGRFILDNGVDLYGNKWPLLYFDKRGDFPPVVPMYVSAIGTYLLGFSQATARLPTAILGALVVLPVFYITKNVFKNYSLGLLAAFMIAITPWHISFSRIGAEGIIATTAFMYGLWFLLSAVNHKHVVYFLISAPFLLSTYLLYPAFRITVPLVMVLAVYMYLKEHNVSRENYAQVLRQPFAAFLIATTVISVLITAYISTTPWGKGRYEQTSIFHKYSGLDNPANQFIFNEDSIAIARIFNNKPLYIARDFIAEYISYFSPDFLFTRGGRPDWFDVPNTGLFYIAYGFMLLPLFLPFLYKKDPRVHIKSLLFLIAVLFVAPIASALTTEFTPNTHRSILMSTMFIFLFVYGLYLINNLKIKKIVYLGIAVLLIGEFILFFHNYFQHVGMYTSILRGDGNRQMVEYLKTGKKNYDKVFMMASGWFPIYYVYFTNNFDRNLVGAFERNMRTDQIDNVRFIEHDCPHVDFYEGAKPQEKINSSEKVLMIVNSSCEFNYHYMFTKIGHIAGADRVPIYNMYRFEPELFKQVDPIRGVNFRKQ